MGILTWQLILTKVLPAYILIALCLSICGILSSLIVPAFKVKKEVFIIVLLLMLVFVFLGMVALAMLAEQFPSFIHFPY